MLATCCHRWSDEGSHYLHVTGIEITDPAPEETTSSLVAHSADIVRITGTLSGCSCPAALIKDHPEGHSGTQVLTVDLDDFDKHLIGGTWVPLPDTAIDLARYLDDTLDLKLDQWEHATAAASSYEVTYDKSFVPVEAMGAIEILNDLGGARICNRAKTMIWGWAYRDTSMVAAALLADLSEGECYELARGFKSMSPAEREARRESLELLAALRT